MLILLMLFVDYVEKLYKSNLSYLYNNIFLILNYHLDVIVKMLINQDRNLQNIYMAFFIVYLILSINRLSCLTYLLLYCLNKLFIYLLLYCLNKLFIYCLLFIVIIIYFIIYFIIFLLFVLFINKDDQIF